MLTAVLSVLVTTTVVLHHAPMSCRHDFPSSSPELCGVAGVIIVVTARTQQGPWWLPPAPVYGALPLPRSGRWPALCFAISGAVAGRRGSRTGLAVPTELPRGLRRGKAVLALGDKPASPRGGPAHQTQGERLPATAGRWAS